MTAPTRTQSLTEEARRVTEGRTFLVELADLTGRHSLLRPDWIFGRRPFLDDPSFACRTGAGRRSLLKDSPAAFKSRSIFVTGNALDRG